eukprot:gene39289-47819_t
MDQNDGVGNSSKNSCRCALLDHADTFSWISVQAFLPIIEGLCVALDNPSRTMASSLFALLLLVCIAQMASGFLMTPQGRASRTAIAMKSNDFQKIFTASVVGASLFFGQQARAEIDYDGIKYLGGGDKIDLNNANIRAYTKLPGVYPNLAAKLVNNGPFKSVADIYNIQGLTSAEKEALKKYESKFVALEEKPEYVLDKINNGLYR